MAADPSAAPASDGEVSVALRDSEVFPGDIVALISTFKRVVLGAGVVRDGTAIRSTKVGKLRWHEADCKLWVQSEQKRYIPELDDHVIGIVTDRHTDEYLVDIGAPAMASLPLLGFDGATKRNRPQARERKERSRACHSCGYQSCACHSCAARSLSVFLARGGSIRRHMFFSQGPFANLSGKKKNSCGSEPSPLTHFVN